VFFQSCQFSTPHFALRFDLVEIRSRFSLPGQLHGLIYWPNLPAEKETRWKVEILFMFFLLRFATKTTANSAGNARGKKFQRGAREKLIEH